MKILVALDQTEKDDTALRKAVDIARVAGAELLLVNVFSPLLDMGHAAPGPREDQERQVEAERQAYLQRQAQSVAGVPVRTVVGKRDRSEEIYEVIARVARDHEVDIIVVSSKHIASLTGVLLGSTVQMLLRISPAPVLIVRPE